MNDRNPPPEREPLGEPPRRPVVSVIVCTNRGGPFLEEALRSVRAQTYGAVECVLVDDGVPDPAALVEMLRPFPEIRVVRGASTGVSAARNRGLAAARGELVAFLDDDDRWDPRRLELGMAPFADPRVVATYCGMRTVDADGAVLVEADQVAVASRLDIARGLGGILLPNLVLRRSAVDDAGGFDPLMRLAEDLDLVLRVAARGTLVLVPEPLVDYRYHEGNTTRRYRALADAIRVIVRRHREEARAAGDEPLAGALTARDQANDRFAAWSAARAARASWGAGERRAAVGDLVWAARFAPRAPWLWLRHRVIG
ncbi:glycosyltransferase family 2 protein [Luteimicrobium sp. NPDC057192]|uniref:glycosyltransferase family 2 protein n=1 Tax=Luteimicrobium sp. NPDC057192 TaxID=3346042 RepID=UPI00363740E5